MHKYIIYTLVLSAIAMPIVPVFAQTTRATDACENTKLRITLVDTKWSTNTALYEAQYKKVSDYIYKSIETLEEKDKDVAKLKADATTFDSLLTELMKEREVVMLQFDKMLDVECATEPSNMAKLLRETAPQYKEVQNTKLQMRVLYQEIRTEILRLTGTI